MQMRNEMAVLQYLDRPGSDTHLRHEYIHIKNTESAITCYDGADRGGERCSYNGGDSNAAAKILVSPREIGLGSRFVFISDRSRAVLLEGYWKTIVSCFLRKKPLLKYQTTGLK